MSKSVIGIDLGTSSVKIIQLFQDGTSQKSKASYKEISKQGWWKSICRALAMLDLDSVEAIGLSSQVGTYIVNGSEVIMWNSGAGKEEVTEIKKKYEPQVFQREISMMHPNIVSYPIPRIQYIKNHFTDIRSICQPKDFICERLTGNCVTDPYSWRGLANLDLKCYSAYFLNELGISKDILPEMRDYTALAGVTKEILLDQKGKTRKLKAGIPVYVGLNDYYASLVGMGIQNSGDLFDISGTSEHLGIIEKEASINTELVSGPYIFENVHYGVTASSGASIKFGLKLWNDKEIVLDKIRRNHPPIFLPYLNGERAPIWDADARGMFFGIGEKCTQQELSYAALEGVVFSLYHIYESMGSPKVKSMKISGGLAVYSALNQLKAEIFEIPIKIMKENETSALGAALVAALGTGWYPNLHEAAKDLCKVKEIIYPTGKNREWLKKRYQIYKELYPAVKLQYEKLKELNP